MFNSRAITDHSALPSGHVITVLNLKGGVGKTHTVWLLASVCQERQRRFLGFDTDVQGNLTNSLLSERDDSPGVASLFHPGSDIDPLTLIRKTPFSHIDLIPSSPMLGTFDLSDQKLWEKQDLHFALRDAVADLRERYDLLVFDCPPRLSLVSFAALCASDEVIIPLEAADWGAQGIKQVKAALEYVQKRYNPNLRLLGYLVSRFKKARAYQQSYVSQLRRHFGENAFDTVIPDLAGFEKSVCDRVPITLHAPGSKEARVARSFFDEVCHRIETHEASSHRRRTIVRVDGTPALA